MNFPFAEKAKATVTWLVFLVMTFVLQAQQPTHLPRHDPEPVGFFDSVENIIFYVVLPLVILFFFLLWRSKRPK
jgi:VanZ family protein